MHARALVLTIAALTGCTPDDGPFGGDVPGRITQEVTEGGPNPAQIVIPLANHGTCALNFSRTIQTVDGAAWLSATPISGTIPANGMANMTLTLDVIAPALTAGTYTGTIVLAGTCATTGRPAAGSPVSIAVNMTVRPNLAGISAGDTTISQDPTTLADVWTPTTVTNAPVNRTGHATVWTGAEMVVWGGFPESGGPIASGGRYEPVNGVWTAMSTLDAPSARQIPAIVWTGQSVIVWGGADATGAPLNTGGLYRPSTNSWTATPITGAPTARSAPAIWTGGNLHRMIVWGGGDALGGRFDPVANSWQPTTAAGAPSTRSGHTLVWTGSRVLVWGGVTGMAAVATGAAYDPNADAWTPISPVGAPSPRHGHTAVWTGSHMIVWGGADSAGNPLGDGALYDPVRDLWIAMNAMTAPSARVHHTAVWNGTEMIVYGGRVPPATNALATGARYNPEADAWTPTTLVDAPFRGRHSAVWTGTEMLIWGGLTDTTALGLGGSYH